MFWLEEGLPASLAPQKRPRTTLTPSMLLKEGKPYLAFGTPGGDQQDQWQTIFLLRHLVGGMNLQEAIDALDKDRGFLKQGDVFTDDMIDGYIELKQEEIQKINNIPHPAEFELYYSV